MKPVVTMAGAFLVGLFGATTISRMMAQPAAAPAADEHGADSVATAGHDTVTTHAPVVANDAAVHAPPDSHATVAADSVPTLSAEVTRIVTVLKGLSQADGAAVVSLLDDPTALEVLRAVGYSRAALLIGELPEARAASLGSALVRTLTMEPGTQ